ncbi:MAG: hypothetical protein WD316_06110 [Phycisphaeraceae bacterium]
MNTLDRCIARARRRLLLTRWLHVLAWWSLAGVGAAAVLLLAERLLGLPVAVGVYGLLAAAVVGGAGAGATAYVRLPGPQAVAELLDDRLGLKDRLGSGLYARGLRDEPMAGRVVADAAQTAERVAVRDALPLTLGRAWAAVPAAAVALAMLFAFVPADVGLLGGLRGESAAADEDADAERQRAAADDEAEVRRLADADLENADADELMDRLASLSNRELGSGAERREAERELTELRDRLEAIYEQEDAQAQSLRSMLSQLDVDAPGPGRELADALRRADYDEAEQQLAALAQQMEDGELTEAQRGQLQTQLEQFQEQLAAIGQQTRADAEVSREQAEKALSDAGLTPEQIEQLRDADEEALREALEQAMREQGLDEQQAREQASQLAKQTSEQQRQAQQQREAGQMSERLGESMGGMAQGLDEQGQAQEGQPGEGGEEGQASEGFAQGAGQGQEELARLAQMQERLQKMAAAGGQGGNAMQQAAGGSPGDTLRQNPNAGGRGAGAGVGNDPIGQERRVEGYQQRGEDAAGEARAGRVIASWSEPGPVDAGEARLQFDDAVTEARSEAEQAVTDDRVPRRYHGSIREYFRQLPTSVEEH